MKITRRDLLKATAAITGAIALKASGLMELEKALAAEGGPPVIWLQGQGCSGCSVSLLNSVENGTVDKLLINLIDLKFHPTVMAGAGDVAVGAAEAAYEAGGYVLVIEGAVSTADNGDYCHIWKDADGKEVTMLEVLERFAPAANVIISVGTCACYGGMSAGAPNPTGAMGVKDALDHLGIEAGVINIPGCPSHPDWIVGSVAMLLAGQMPELDGDDRPKVFFGEHVHSNCPNRKRGVKATKLGEAGCLSELGCNGQQTYSDCPIRKWNSPAKDEEGVNWCVGSRNPCQGCTEPDFPDGKSPFYTL